MPTQHKFVINGSTRLAGVIGWPISHTLSPAIQNAAFAFYKINAVYLPLGVPESGLKALIDSLGHLGALGANVTVPYKEKVMTLLDEISPLASKIGAVNTIVFQDGRRVGHNTDGPGFLASLKGNINPKGKWAVLLGGGGGGRAIAVSLIEAGVAGLVIAELDAGKRERLMEDLGKLGKAALLGVTPGSEELKQALARADLVVNATPLGLKPGDPLVVPVDWLPQGRCVMDIVYGKKLTPLLLAARRRKNKIIPGWTMLLNQGAEAFRLWTGKKPPLDVMRKALFTAGRIRREKDGGRRLG